MIPGGSCVGDLYQNQALLFSNPTELIQFSTSWFGHTYLLGIDQQSCLTGCKPRRPRQCQAPPEQVPTQTINSTGEKSDVHGSLPSFPAALRGRCYASSLFTDSGFPGGSEDKTSACNEGGPSSIPGLGRTPGEGNGNPLQLFLPGESRGQRSLAIYSPRGRKELDTTERLHSLPSSGGHEGGMKGIDQDSLRAGRTWTRPPPQNHTRGCHSHPYQSGPGGRQGTETPRPPTQVEATPAELQRWGVGGRCRPR